MFKFSSSSIPLCSMTITVSQENVIVWVNWYTPEQNRTSSPRSDAGATLLGHCPTPWETPNTGQTELVLSVSVSVCMDWVIHLKPCYMPGIEALGGNHGSSGKCGRITSKSHAINSKILLFIRSDSCTGIINSSWRFINCAFIPNNRYSDYPF